MVNNLISFLHRYEDFVVNGENFLSSDEVRGYLKDMKDYIDTENGYKIYLNNGQVLEIEPI